jgi:hypothetical protein
VNESGEEDPDVPVYVALKGEVFNVSGARHAYGKEGGYHVFAGKYYCICQCSSLTVRAVTCSFFTSSPATSAAHFSVPVSALSITNQIICTGHDASCNLAKMSFEEADLDTMAWDKLSYSERDALDNWIETFRHYKAYPVVGRVITHATPYPLPVFTKVCDFNILPEVCSAHSHDGHADA